LTEVRLYRIKDSSLVPYARREKWRRLVVHVADVDAPGAHHRLLDKLGIELMDVPF
jgi:hypothetical protein